MLVCLVARCNQRRSHCYDGLVKNDDSSVENNDCSTENDDSLVENGGAPRYL